MINLVIFLGWIMYKAFEGMAFLAFFIIKGFFYVMRGSSNSKQTVQVQNHHSEGVMEDSTNTVQSFQPTVMEQPERVNSIPSTAFKNSFNQVIPITNIGRLTLMIYLDERKAKRSLVITNEALATNLGMNKIILEELHASEELTTNELSEVFLFTVYIGHRKNYSEPNFTTRSCW